MPQYEEDYPPEYFSLRKGEGQSEFVGRLRDLVADLVSCDVTVGEIEAFLLKRNVHHSFISVVLANARQSERENRAPPEVRDANNQILTGLALLGIGVGVTALSYLFAAPGGTYIVASGAMVWGGWRLFSGLVDVADRKRDSE